MKSIETFIALNRFGLGAAPGEAESLGDDPRGWIKSQIRTDLPVPKPLVGLRTSEQILTDLFRATRDGGEKRKEVTRKVVSEDYRPTMLARAKAAVTTKTPFAERMVAFWSNHFTVSTKKIIVRPGVPAFEQDVVRPHVFGKFSDMLLASSQHPVMLTYLDNDSSAGERSTVGERRMETLNVTRTINENLGREILELHTLGVNGGYTQDDVIALSEAISGWTTGGVRPMLIIGGAHGGYRYDPRAHQPGPKVVLGKRYPEAGEDEGRRILADLAIHPSTAKHLATKLVRHFVSDDPPPAAVDRIAAVFLETNGDLAAVSAALVDLPEVWIDPLPKVKTPWELVISTHRFAGTKALTGVNYLKPLKEMQQEPYAASSPAGWGDVAGDWLGPESLMRRIEWLRAFSATLPASMIPQQVLDDLIGPVSQEATRTWVERAPSGDAAIALILASPEFQRR